MLVFSINYWSQLEDLLSYEEADIICDEVGNYFDARMWADLSLDTLNRARS